MRARVCVRVCECVCAPEGCVSECVCALCACVQELGNSCLGGSPREREKGSEGRERGARRGRMTTPSAGRQGGGGKTFKGIHAYNSRAFRNSRERKLPQLVRALPPPLATGLWDGHGGACPPASSGPPAPRPSPHCPVHE